MRWSSLLVVAMALSGCVSGVTGTAWTDGRFTWVNVKSASDVAGGPRQDVILAVDWDGKPVGQWQAAGMGTLQSLVGSLAPAMMTAAGVAAAGALQRPARNTTNVEMNVAGTGGGGGAGGSAAGGVSTATGGTATGVISNER